MRKLTLTLVLMLMAGCTTHGRWSLGGESWGRSTEEEPRQGEFARKGPGVLVSIMYRY